MAKHLNILIVLLGAALALSSCRSSRSVEKTAVPEATGQTAAPSAANAEEYIARLSAQRPSTQTLTARIKMTLSATGKDLNVNGSLRMKRDDVVQLSLTFLGFEVARMEFSPTDVLLIDRYNHRYVRAAYADVDFLAKAGLDFSALQALFWNELFRPAEADSTYQIASSKDHTTLTLSGKANLSYVFSTLTSQALLESLTVRNSQSSKAGRFVWTYSDFTQVLGHPFPATMECSLSGVGTNASFKIALSKFSDNADWEAHTTVSDKYTPMSANALLNRLFKGGKK